MTPISLQDRSEDGKMTHLAVQSSATSGCAREARCLRGSIPPRAPRAPKGRRCRGRRCPPLGTSRSPVARDGGGGMEGVQSVGGGGGREDMEGPSRRRQARAWGRLSLRFPPASGVPCSPRSSRVSPGGPQRNRGSDPRRRLQGRNLWSDLPLGPQLQLLQQLPADSETFSAIPSDPEWSFRTIPSETF